MRETALRDRSNIFYPILTRVTFKIHDTITVISEHQKRRAWLPALVALPGNCHARRMQSHGAIFTRAFDQFFGSAHDAEAFVALGELSIMFGVTAAFTIRYHERFLGCHKLLKELGQPDRNFEAGTEGI